MDAILKTYTSLGTYSYGKTDAKKRTETTETKATSTAKTDDTGKTEYTAGKRVGEPKLSEKAEKYYESLKEKYEKMDFILVSSDMKDTAKSLASSFANPNKTVVLIDEEKIEKMANDENYRAKYESIIENAAGKMDELKNGLASSGADIRGFGMQVNDNGTVSFFATVNKSLSDTREKLAEKRAEKKEEAKAEEKKEAKKEAAEKLEEKRAEEMTEEEAKEILSNFETIEADSVEALLRKVSEFSQNLLTDRSETEAEKYVGKNFDFKL